MAKHEIMEIVSLPAGTQTSGNQPKGYSKGKKRWKEIFRAGQKVPSSYKESNRENWE